MPVAMRSLFVQILIYGSPENPKHLWETFKENLSEDFIHVQNFGFENIDNYDLEDNQENLNTDESAVLGEQMYLLLKGKQIEVVNSILQAVNNTASETKCFFIDGPGGTGKTFIYKTLYHMLTGKRYRVKCMAFTGIASILLPNGRTCHKTFGLKVPLTPDSVSSIKPNSPKARKLSEIDIFLMDEAPMLPKYEQRQFADYLLKLGNGELTLNTMEEIELPQNIISSNNLIDEVFGNCLANGNYEGMKDRAILAPLNKDVEKINDDIVSKLPGEYKIYYSHDSMKINDDEK
ncbi:unnamed protein product [Euphydryas editha]|uniref:ATP-dependent DNA helicase n=1 Tax=Euphydryas editha TaxID=104508 RepID=A0AAU9TGX2_EUPED|nr:unnamed protein product [Euphydryas editha]